MNEYLDRITRAIEKADPKVCSSLSRKCHECGKGTLLMPFPYLETDHVLLGPWIIIGCEGYWQIDPNLVGFDSPHWSPPIL